MSQYAQRLNHYIFLSNIKCNKKFTGVYVMVKAKKEMTKKFIHEKKVKNILEHKYG